MPDQQTRLEAHFVLVTDTSKAQAGTDALRGKIQHLDRAAQEAQKSLSRMSQADRAATTYPSASRRGGPVGTCRYYDRGGGRRQGPSLRQLARPHAAPDLAERGPVRPPGRRAAGRGRVVGPTVSWGSS